MKNRREIALLPFLLFFWTDILVPPITIFTLFRKYIVVIIHFMKIIAGIDIGSTTTKVVLLREQTIIGSKNVLNRNELQENGKTPAP